MRPRRAYGRPGTPVIPPRWAESHRPVVAGTMTATVELRHPGATQAWDPDLEQMVAVPFPPYWTGPARITELATRDQVKVTAGDREVVIRYDLAVDSDVVATGDDLATVTEVDDAFLLGRALLVVQITGGSLRFERILGCSLND